MYSTCLFCSSGLGRNEAIEHLPVGRRLAFDPVRGRLWVVCPRCARWNLTPFEERWEALEECEKGFRGTATRFSTENIGLARLPEGLELVRIGKPRRPEFAGWRYGDEFVRRNRRMAPLFALTAAVPLAAFAWMVTGGAGTTMLAPVLLNGPFLVQGLLTSWRPVATIRTDVHHSRVVRGRHAYAAKIRESDDDDGWVLDIPHRGGFTRVRRPTADTLLSRIVARVNMAGARRKRVRAALIELDTAGYGERYLEHVVRTHRARRLLDYPSYARLALEMATHEASERRAMEGDLVALEEAWRQAEEIAAIADRLPDAPA